MAQSGDPYKINKRPKDDIDGDDAKAPPKPKSNGVNFAATIMESVISEDEESGPDDIIPDIPRIDDNNSSFSFSKKPHKHGRGVSFQEMQGVQEVVNTEKEERQFQPKPNDIRIMGRKMTVIRGLIETPRTITLERSMECIKNICIIVVVDAEIRPIMEKYKFQEDEILTEQFMNLGIVSSGDVGSLHLNIIKVAESKVFQRHYSGYTQSAALAALVSTIIRPDIVISFGTAGGVTHKSKSEYGMGRHLKEQDDIKSNDDTKPDDDTKSDENTKSDVNGTPDALKKSGSALLDKKGQGIESEAHHEQEASSSSITPMVDEVKIGDVVLGEACLFLDRLRTRNKKAFDWGLWGGSSMPVDVMVKECNLIKGVVASQIGYMVSPFQVEMIGNANIVALDMECAPIAQILNQTGIDFFALKVISNGIYPGNPELMESEYHDNREMVSKKATEVLTKVIDYLDGKTKYALSPKKD